VKRKPGTIVHAQQIDRNGSSLWPLRYDILFERRFWRRKDKVRDAIEASSDAGVKDSHVKRTPWPEFSSVPEGSVARLPICDIAMDKGCLASFCC
jgi:hypothetical protein